MDSAYSDSVRSALYSQSQRLSHHDERLNSISQRLCDLVAFNKNFQSSIGNQFTLLIEPLQQPLSRGPAPELSAPAPASAPVSTSFSLPHLAHPECFTGDWGDCRTVLIQCGLHFELQGPLFPTDRTKVAYLLSYLAERAKAWATGECNVRFLRIIPPAGRQLTHFFDLRQSKARVTGYAIEFRTLAAHSGWNASSLFDIFIHGHSGQIKDQLTPLEVPPGIDSLIALCLKIDDHLRRGKKRERGVLPEVFHATGGSLLHSTILLTDISLLHPHHLLLWRSWCSWGTPGSQLRKDSEAWWRDNVFTAVSLVTAQWSVQ